MIVAVFAIFHYFLLFFVQILNNTVMCTLAPIVPAGLFVHSPIFHLGTGKAITLCCLTGSMLDGVFPFCPFGFGATFYIFFHCAQRLILKSGYPLLARYRIALEQIATVSYVFFLFIFRPVPMSTCRLLLTAVFSQIFTLALSNRIFLCHGKIAAIWNNCARYRP